jgi:hypothetical protein
MTLSITQNLKSSIQNVSQRKINRVDPTTRIFHLERAQEYVSVRTRSQTTAVRFKNRFAKDTPSDTANADMFGEQVTEQ